MSLVISPGIDSEQSCSCKDMEEGFSFMSTQWAGHLASSARDGGCSSCGHVLSSTEHQSEMFIWRRLDGISPHSAGYSQGCGGRYRKQTLDWLSHHLRLVSAGISIGDPVLSALTVYLYVLSYSGIDPRPLCVVPLLMV